VPAKVVPVTDPILIGFGAHLGAMGRGQGTIAQRQRYARRLLAGRHPGQLDVDDVELWLAAHPHWADNTRRSAITSICQFYAWWIPWERRRRARERRAGEPKAKRAKDPTRHLEAPPEAEPCPKPCPDDVFEAALSRAGGDRYWLLRVAESTGMRRAELAGLHSDMLVGRCVTIEGKGRKKRTIPVTSDVAAWLAGRGWAFPSPYGGHVQADAVGKRLTRALGRPWTAHSLRHKFATRTYAECGSLVIVQRLLGHASLATTQRYLGVTDQELAAAVAWAERPTLRLVG
jgi:integrase